VRKLGIEIIVGELIVGYSIVTIVLKGGSALKIAPIRPSNNVELISSESIAPRDEKVLELGRKPKM
jgi:hypothetical protein